MTCKEALFPTTGTDKKAMDERCPLLVLASVSNMICGTLTVILGLIQILISRSSWIPLGSWEVCGGLLYLINGIACHYYFNPKRKCLVMSLALSMMCCMFSFVALAMFAASEFMFWPLSVGISLTDAFSGMALSVNIFAALLVYVELQKPSPVLNVFSQINSKIHLFSE